MAPSVSPYRGEFGGLYLKIINLLLLVPPLLEGVRGRLPFLLNQNLLATYNVDTGSGNLLNLAACEVVDF